MQHDITRCRIRVHTTAALPHSFPFLAMKLTLTKFLVAAVLAVIVAVASFEVVDAGAGTVFGTREFGALANTSID